MTANPAALGAALDRRPALVLLNIVAEPISYPAFVRAVRRLPGRTCPVYPFTAGTDAGQRAGRIGAEGVLAKPFDLAELLDLARRHIE